MFALPALLDGQMHRGPGAEKIELTQRSVSGPGGVPVQPECSADLFGFAPLEAHKAVAAFDGGAMASEPGAMLLGAAGWQVRPAGRLPAALVDPRDADQVVHEVAGLVVQTRRLLPGRTASRLPRFARSDIVSACHCEEHSDEAIPVEPRTLSPDQL